MKRLLSLAAAILFCVFSAVGEVRNLETGFAAPPASARPRVWWCWLDSNITKEGITRELEEMSRQGIGKAMIWDAGSDVYQGTVAPPKKGPVGFLSPGWLEMFRHAVAEADRLGIELSLYECNGWSLGGPWITPELTGQRLNWSEKRVKGGAKIDEVLPVPNTPRGVNDNFYRDVAVMAFRVPPEVAAQAVVLSAATQSSVTSYWAAHLAVDGITGGLRQDYSYVETAADDASPWWQLDLGKETPVEEIEIWRKTADSGDLEISNADVIVLDGNKQELWRKNLGEFKGASVRLKLEPAANARFVRIEKPKGVLSFAEVFVFSGGRNIIRTDGKRVRDWMTKTAQVGSTGDPAVWKAGLDWEDVATPDVEPGTMVDLKDKMDASGRLVWDAPAGDWTILRLGHTAGTSRTKSSTAEGWGYEVNELSKKSAETQFSSLTQKCIDAAGPLTGKSFRYVFIDSWESIVPSWTEGFREEFQRRRGYDLSPYFPALTGRIVENAGVTDRFLWDFRRTIADLSADNLFGRTAELCHAKGLQLESEAYGGSYFDNLQTLGRTDVPFGEFWSYISGPPDVLRPNLGIFSLRDGFSRPIEAAVKTAASAAHTYGKKVVGSESWTAPDYWRMYPFLMKAEGDRAMCEGINHFIAGSYTHQPDPEAKPPGLRYLWSPIGNYKNTWWGQSRAWHDYLTRCSYLLQQGLYVADFACFRGEGVPYSLRLDPAQFPPGYSYDECNAEVLLTRMSVKDGKIVLPDGMSYRVLVLPDATSMTPRVLRKIAEMVEAGATVVGPKPTVSPSLENYPACDNEVSGLADKVWGPCDGKTVTEHAYGKGKVVWGKPLPEVLQSEKIKPDFEYVSSQNDPVVRWIHRTDQGAEIYYVANQRNRPEELECTFRVGGKAPELWHPDTGMITHPAVYDEADGRTRMPLHLDPLGSAFVVFRSPAKADRIVSLSKDGKPLFPGGSCPAKETPMVEVLEEAADPVTKIREAAPTTTGAKASPAGATSNSPGQASAPPWDPKKTEPCPEGAASPNGTNAAPSKPVIKIWETGKYEMKTASGKPITVESGPITAPIEIAGPWEVKFPPGLGAPASAVFDKLASWTNHAEAGIKYFSGTATYVKEIEIPADFVGKSLYLDLGKVNELAGVRLNGKDLGTLWKPPFLVDVSQAVKPGKNLLEVKVTNRWANRLIGDQFLPEAERITHNTDDKHFAKNSTLQESGLLGPVMIRPVENRRLETK